MELVHTAAYAFLNTESVRTHFLRSAIIRTKVICERRITRNIVRVHTFDRTHGVYFRIESDARLPSTMPAM